MSAAGKLNCWEATGCGREVGGGHAAEFGVCPAALSSTPGCGNGGLGAGRVCWAVAGTLCGGAVQGTWAQKLTTCTHCPFFERVRREEEAAFQLLPDHAAHPGPHEQFISLMAVVDELNAVVTAADMETYELLFANSYARELHGPALLGRRCYEALLAGQAGPCADCVNARLLVDGEPGPPVAHEVESAATGRSYLHIDKAIRWWNGRLARLSVGIDVTERKRAERFREEYVGLVSHDLQNPLGNVYLRAGLLRRSLAQRGLDGEARMVDEILGDARRMNRLIADLLETARLDSGSLELHKQGLELCRFVASGVDRLPPAEACRIHVYTGPAPLDVEADPDRLDRVLDNLLSNALKFSGDKPITVAVRQEGCEGIVTVRDEGPGVPPDQFARLFQRFARAASPERPPGHGLGLYNARMIVEAHGGRIWAESEAGRGAAFHFALPLPAAA